MTKIRFTFGSDPAYPYTRGDYVVVIGTDLRDCFDAFTKRHPKRPGSNALNCADYYREEEWEKLCKEHYDGVAPKEIIISDNIHGPKPEGFEPIWFYVPSKKAIVFLQEGSGDNLNEEDQNEGNVDYMDYTSYTFGHGELVEDESGMLMTKEFVQQTYTCLADAICDILDCMYNDPYLDAKILTTPNSSKNPEYGIYISYSWEEHMLDGSTMRADEPLIPVGTKENAWKKAKELALNEAELAGTEHDCPISLYFNEDETQITLGYTYDNTYCYYKIVHL